MAGFLFGYLPLYASFSKKICEETVFFIGLLRYLPTHIG